MARALLILPTVCAVTTSLVAQDNPEDIVRIATVEEEVALARSAAPRHVSEHATVLVLKDGRYEIGARGSSEVTCMVARSRAGSLEPICYDPEASRTVMQIEIRRNELRFAGTPAEEIDASIAESIGRGELGIPVRPSLAYMMSSGQLLVSEEGQAVGSWLPHLMLYMPYLEAKDLGLYGPPSMTAAAVFDEGLPTAHLVIAVRDFVDPVP